jgi:hypothetical protein
VQKVFKKVNIMMKGADQTKLIEKTVTYQFLNPLMGEHRKQPRRRPQVGRIPDRLRHTGAGPQAATGGLKQSRSPSKGLGWPSSRKDKAAASEAAKLLGCGTAR